MKYQAITQNIIGASMEVHTIPGMDFRRLFISCFGIGDEYKGSFQRQYEMDIYYKGERIGGRRVDYFVENCINRLNHDLPDLRD